MPRPTISAEPEEEMEINLSPMIDCIFILLIFFIVTTVFVEETGVEVVKPRVVAYDKLDKNSLQFAITSENKVIYGGQEIGVGGVAVRVKQAMSKGDVPIDIQADERADVGLFDKVVTEAKLAGATRIAFSSAQN
ncbi:biopolymer transporter ExbD [Ruficoccus amylovorans]|uniref:Biopolymer transporter ExbD n=1 Tax=Ruficoccus amylovorans TaxID=1804625 RepID=A0A842HFM0_9BACT|nr:biopolymer transporter ExbD [Ruficoccus amylovorans]MBC2594838.1 biopolymer transporter ExbD [Ruficoccus amylovorans]